MMNAPKLVFAPLAALCALVGMLALWSVPALAARGHVFGGSFAGGGSADGQLSEPQGVAVNESSGDVYVADRGNHRVERFTSNGVFVAAWGWGVSDGASEYEVCASGCRAGLSGSGEGQLSEPEGVAVDNSKDPSDPSAGDVYVAQSNVVEKFSSTGAYIGELTEASPGVGLSEISGIAVDPTGELWVAFKGGGFFEKTVASFDDAVVNGFVASRELVESGGAYLDPGFAVDSQDSLYVDFAGYSTAGFVMKFDSSGKVVNEGFEQEGALGQISAIAVEPASDDPYIDNIETVVRLTPEGQAIERLGSGHLTHGTGVVADASSETVYVADSSVNVVDVFTPEPPGKPRVESEDVSNVAAGSATFEAQLLPKGLAGDYRFEYGPCSSSAVASCATSGYETDVPVPDASIGSGWDLQSVSAHTQSLTAHTTYHFRVAAHNVDGEVVGEEVVFTTQTAGGELQLLDGRQWQMVSPPDKYGALIDGIGALSVGQASSSGDAVTYFTPFVATEQDPQGSPYGGQVLSTRGPDGWSSQDIATPHNEPTGLPLRSEYLFFSVDFSRALVEPVGPFTSLQACSSSGCVGESFPEATEWTPYVRNNSTCASEVSSCYEPLLTSAKGYADVPSGTKFDTGGEGEFMGASPDLTHAVLQSTAQLTSTPTASHEEMYEWSADEPASERLRLVSVLPADEGGGPVPSDEGLYLGGAEEPYATGWRAISTDGSRIFFTVGEKQEGTRRLYMRDTAKEETVRLDVEQSGAPGGESPSATFLAASADGSRVFFRDRQRLTAHSGKGGNGPYRLDGAGNDLYECQIVEEAGRDACKLTDLTPEGSGGSAEVQNILPGTGEDGSYVYFVANGVLAPGAVPGACRYYAPPFANVTCNLYVYHAGKITFVATLAYADETDWGGTDVTFHNIGRLTARVSPNGRYITFMSDRSLTGYDNRDAVTGRPDEEVYEYDAVTEKLVCASCDPTGARPVGVKVGEFQYGNLADVANGSGVGDYNNETGIAANVPTGDSLEAYGESLNQPRYLSDSGRLFFDGSDALVPQDVNGQEDVYEYEPVGAGSCSVSSLTYGERSSGCVDLISSGTSGQESGFLDASETGGDVFFVTTSKLASADFDSARDVYDARECTVQEPCTTPAVALPPCSSGEGCKPAQSVQPSLFGSPSSQTFSGTGNLVQPVSKPVVERKSLTRAQKLAVALKVCKEKRKKRTVCERQARKQFGASKPRARKSRKGNASKRGGR
jgi:hypothetical protein